MIADPLETTVPIDSLVASLLPGSYFHDAWEIKSNAVDLSALGHFLGVVEHTPRWVNLYMILRNRIVSLLGLKNLGQLSTLGQEKLASAYRPGDRVGIFTLFENTVDEALLGDKDKHLNVFLSVHRRLVGANEILVTVTTIVHVHNALGRIYMVPVKPMHRLIVRAVLSAFVRAQNKRTISPLSGLP